MQSSKILTSEELIARSKECLEPSIFDFISGGSGSEWGLNNNMNSIKRIQIVPRVLQKAGTIDTNLNLLGKKFPSPICIAPSAFHKLVCKQGELETARAAARTNTIFTLSSMSTCSIEDVAQASNFDKWFQLYMFKDKEITQDLVRRAESSGYSALVVTVDLPAMGIRPKDIKNKFALPQGIEAANFKKFGLSSLSQKSDGSKVKEHTDQQFDADLGWEAIDWLRSITKMPIILKGILHPDDAFQALKCKVNGIIVSNHGGRQIDNVISTIDALPEIVKVIGNSMPILVDGGFRSGEDVFKAIALGAHAVMIARPVMWALSIGGEEELVSLMSRLQEELTLTMRLAGCNNLQMIRERGLSLLGGEYINNIKLMGFLTDKLNNNSLKPEQKFRPSSSPSPVFFGEN